MEKPGLDKHVSSSPSDQKRTKLQETRRRAVQPCTESLVHATCCQEVTCPLPQCRITKSLLMHMKFCQAKFKTNGGCYICKRVMSSCFFHAKGCSDVHCPLILCLAIKMKIQLKIMEQQLKYLQVDKNWLL